MSSHSVKTPEKLFILPFDHRGSFQEKLMGIQGRQPTSEEVRQIAAYKRIVFEGFKKAILLGVPREKAGILVDEQFGGELLEEARQSGWMTSCPAEKSGQEEFDFEYGDRFSHHIEKYQPTYVKVLVRYNPESDVELNRRQCQRLKRLSDYCQTHQQLWMFELLVPPTAEQMKKVAGQTQKFDLELRPLLMIQAMKQIQAAGIEPSLWKLEGIDSLEHSRQIAQQARAGGREHVGLIILGRGEDAQKVNHWLKLAAQTPGWMGFAVGRTVFWEPLQAVKKGEWTPQQASDQIAQRYYQLCHLWMQTDTSASA